jgi:rhodanese-related sulfurtransferase
MIAVWASPTLESWLSRNGILAGLVFVAVCLLLALLIALPRLASWRRGRGRPVLDPVQASELLSGSGALVVDLRSPEAFKAGRIRGSLNLPFTDLAARFQSPDPKSRRDMILVDETDELSHRAYDLLSSRGFQGIFVMKGGMRAWRAAHRPLSR